jgi:hypothetical protein
MRVKFAAALSCLLTATTAFAVTIEALPGTTPQSTQISAFFPVEMGVVVRDDFGQPLAGEPVHFLLSDVMSTFVNAGGVMDMVTDANGIAIPSMHIALNNGTSFMQATTPGATQPVIFDITVTGEVPSAMALLSGQSQTVHVNTQFSQRIVAQVFTPNRKAVPYAAVEFYLRPDAVPSGVFESGSNWVIVKADANGVAMAPDIVANGIVGQEYGLAIAMVTTYNNSQYANASQLFKYKLIAP